MNTFAAHLRARSARWLRLHVSHRLPRPHSFRPCLEGLESRVVPAGTLTALSPALGLAAEVRVVAPAAAPIAATASDQLDSFWSAHSSSSTAQSAAAAPHFAIKAAFATTANSPQAAVVNQAAMQLPTVTVSNPDDFATEDSTQAPGTPQTQDTATFRIARTGGAGNADPLTVLYNLTGTAQNGVDYQLLSGVAAIPAGKDFVDVTVVPLPRPPFPFPGRTVSLQLSASASYTLGPVKQAVAFIAQLPVNNSGPGGSGGSGGSSGGGIVDQGLFVMVSNPDAIATVDSTLAAGKPQTDDTATFRISRFGAGNAGSLTVTYSLMGTAQNGVDYQLLSGVAVIPDGQDFVDVMIVPQAQSSQSGPSIVKIQLTQNEGSAYQLAPEDNAVAFIFQKPINGGGGGNPGGGGQPTPPPNSSSAPSPAPFIFSGGGDDPATSIALGGGDKRHEGDLVFPPPPPFVNNPGIPPDLPIRPLDPNGLLNPMPGGTDAIGEISGRLFEDTTGDGVDLPSKPGLPGVLVFLDYNNNGYLDVGEPSRVTNKKGEYFFTGLPRGTYVVRLAAPGKVVQTAPADNAPHEVTLVSAADAAAMDRNFGLQMPANRIRPAVAPPTPKPPPPKPKDPSAPNEGGGAGGESEGGEE